MSAELILRLPIVTEHLPAPEPTLWHAELIQSKIDYLQAVDEKQAIDVLFMGNSTTQAGVNPKIFDKIRGNATEVEPNAFNASIEGLTPFGNLMFLQIYLRYSHPQTIIYGITPQDLNSNSPWAKDVTDRVKHSPMALAEARWGIKGEIIAKALDYSSLYRYRFVLHRMLLRGGVLPPLPQVHFDDKGYNSLSRRLSDIPQTDRGIFYGRAGVLNYLTTGEQQEALREFIEYCRKNDIDLIFVNMPLADDYYNNFDTPQDYETYLSTLTQISDEYKIPLWDMENLPSSDRFNDTEFADFNHLNKYGAEKLSILLAKQYIQQSIAGSAFGLE
ncbi:MAG: hypothetical protein KDJ52_01065 [Anaerolineae bacterium]|nr:hypothetical protein [Anaerolineae bacterium]